MLKIIFASHNQGKVLEMRSLLKDINIEILSAEEAGFVNEVVEDGLTFADNALKKAKEVSAFCNLPAIADDSGLCVEALAGLPGIYSARWAGRNATDEMLVAKLLSEMTLVSENRRNAEFVSVVAMAWPDGREAVFEGRVKGLITMEPKGDMRAKLPYDVLFLPVGYEKTYAQMTDDEKNSISHRGEAFKKLKKYIQDSVNLI